MTFTMALAHLRTGEKVRLPSWPSSHYLLTEYYGEGPGGGTHLLRFSGETKYSGYDEWIPILEELSSTDWEVI